MRLFIAIQFPEAIKNILTDSIAQLRKAAIKGNFTRRENLHLTVVFIGETDQEARIQEVMKRIENASFRLTMGGFGHFPRRGGDIYWVGVDSNLELTNLYQELYGRLSSQGLSLENRPYRPHLTLGRRIVVPENFDHRDFSERIPPMSMKVEAISLMNSLRINNQLTYKEIYRKELRD
ncbi:MAG: RNA 2',3'-cyclic phosphodiesterase [Dehalobacterium sp.]|jgi:2'-5' RNA ligase